MNQSHKSQLEFTPLEKEKYKKLVKMWFYNLKTNKAVPLIRTPSVKRQQKMLDLFDKYMSNTRDLRIFCYNLFVKQIQWFFYHNGQLKPITDYFSKADIKKYKTLDVFKNITIEIPANSYANQAFSLLPINTINPFDILPDVYLQLQPIFNVSYNAARSIFTKTMLQMQDICERIIGILSKDTNTDANTYAICNLYVYDYLKNTANELAKQMLEESDPDAPNPVWKFLTDPQKIDVRITNASDFYKQGGKKSRRKTNAHKSTQKYR